MDLRLPFHAPSSLVEQGEKHSQRERGKTEPGGAALQAAQNIVQKKLKHNLTVITASRSLRIRKAVISHFSSFLFVSSFHYARRNRLGVVMRLAVKQSWQSFCSKSSASLFGFGRGKGKNLPQLIQAGDPVLHEPAAEVPLVDIGSERVQNVIDDMISVMRNSFGVGLAAPQIGVPLQIIVLEDRQEYIDLAPAEETKLQERFSFDLQVVINPKLKKRGQKTARFFEGCLSVNGYRGLVERDLDVEVSGIGRDGARIKIEASGWKARILQHECDHLDGFIYVDKIIQRSFRTVRLPFPFGCPKPG